MHIGKLIAVMAALSAQSGLAAEQLFTLSFTASNPSLFFGASTFVPPAEVSGSFAFRYDPNNAALYATPRAVQQVSLNIGGWQFNAPTTFFESPTLGGALNTIGFGDVQGVGNTIASVGAGIGDFRLVLGRWGGPFGQQADSLVFSVPGENAFWQTSDITYTVSTAAVPEPGSWAMMLVGFGLLGMMLRNRRYAAMGMSGTVA